MAGARGQSNKGDRATAMSRYGETIWFRKNRKKKRDRAKIARASKRANRKR